MKEEKFNCNWVGFIIFLAFLELFFVGTFIMNDFLEETIVYFYLLGPVLFFPFFISFLIILSALKFLVDKFILKNSDNKIFFKTLLILLAFVIFIFPFFNTLNYLQEIFLEDSSNLYFVYPWPFLILVWLALINIFSKIYRTKKPVLWKQNIEPAIFWISVLSIISPVIFLLG